MTYEFRRARSGSSDPPATFETFRFLRTILPSWPAFSLERHCSLVMGQVATAIGKSSNEDHLVSFSYSTTIRARPELKSRYLPVCFAANVMRPVRMSSSSMPLMDMSLRSQCFQIADSRYSVLHLHYVKSKRQIVTKL